MHKSERILKAIGNIDEEIVETVSRKQGYLGTRNAQPYNIRVVSRIFVVAALLAALFTVSAYAMGWFGLSAWLTPWTAVEGTEESVKHENDETDAGFIAFNAYANSPEAMAGAEWMSFRLNYDWPLSPEESRAWEEEHADDPAMLYYGAFDDVSYAKLYEIIEKYGIELHTAAVTPQSEEMFFDVTGLEPFLVEAQLLAPHVVYEGGSFTVEATFEEGTIRLNRGAKGALIPGGFYLRDAGNYEEWQTRTEDGIVINFAQGKERDEYEGYTGFMFCEVGEYLISLHYNVPQGESFYSSAEILSAKILFSELSKGNTDLGLVLNYKAHAAEREPGLLTVEALMSSPEYIASVAFQRAYNEWYDENGRIAVANRGNGYTAGQYDKGYYGSFPCGKGELDELMDSLEKEYSLQAPSSVEAIYNGSWIDPGKMLEPMWFEERYEPLNPATENDGWEMIGCEPFLDYEPTSFICWDNGAWRVDNVIFVPYGAINPVLRAIQDPTANCWSYNTDCGAQVLFARAETLFIQSLVNHTFCMTLEPAML